MKRLQIIILLLLVASVIGGVTWWTLLDHNPIPAPALSTNAITTHLPVVVESVPLHQSVPIAKASFVAPVSIEQSPEKLPASLQLILSPPPHTSYRTRVTAVHALGKDLDEEEINALADYLRMPQHDNAVRWAEGEYWLRNDIMDKLVTQETIPTGLADLLVGIYRNRSQDPVMRDYAVQYLPCVYKQMDAADQTSVRRVLWQATDETSGSIAGTALLAMLTMTAGADSMATTTGATAVSADSINRVQLTQTALRLASDDHCGELSRIAAISICGRLGAQDALPVLENLAQRGASVPLRTTAIAALGDIGAVEASGLLRRLLIEGNPRLQPALQRALGQLVKN